MQNQEEKYNNSKKQEERTPLSQECRSDPDLSSSHGRAFCTPLGPTLSQNTEDQFSKITPIPYHNSRTTPGSLGGLPLNLFDEKSITRAPLESSKLARAMAQNALNQATAKKAFYNLTVGVIQEESSFLASAYQDCISTKEKELMTMDPPNFQGLMPFSRKLLTHQPRRKHGHNPGSDRAFSPSNSSRNVIPASYSSNMRPPSTHSSPKVKSTTSRQNSTHSKKRLGHNHPTLLSINALSDGAEEVSDVTEVPKKPKMESYRTEKRKLFSLKYEDSDVLSLGYDSSKEGLMRSRKVAKTGREVDVLDDQHESHISEERKLSLTSHSLAREKGGSRKQSTEEKKKSKFCSQRHGSGDFQVQPSQLGAQNKLVPLAVSGARDHGKSAGTLADNMAIQRMLLTQQIGQKKQGEGKKRAGMKGQPGQKRVESQRDFIIRKTHMHH